MRYYGKRNFELKLYILMSLLRSFYWGWELIFYYHNNAPLVHKELEQAPLVRHQDREIKVFFRQMNSGGVFCA